MMKWKSVMKNEFDLTYHQFIRRVIAQRSVFTLQDEADFFAECPSEAYDNDLGEPETVYCFWDSRQAAMACQQDEWADFTLTEIPLSDFMYEVLTSMDADHHLVGVAFDANLVGSEIEPIELLADLLDEIEQAGLADEFPEFDELQNYRLEWEKLAWQQQTIH